MHRSDLVVQAETLKRTLSWPAVAAYGLGSILGAGIYSVIGSAADVAGEAMWMAFALSALVALVTALSYAELSTMFPRAGAEFVYLRSAMPRWPLIATTIGVMTVLSSVASTATVSLAFNGYMSGLVGVTSDLFAPGLIIVMAVVGCIGVTESTRMVAVFTGIEAAGLIVVVVLGATSPRFGAAFAATPTPAVFSGAALVFFSYLGFQNIANLAEETKQPGRNMPRAIFASLAVASVLYVLVAVAAIALLPVDQLAASDAPLADAVRARSPAAAGALGGIALFATANTAMAAIVAGSRVLYAIANDGHLPTILGRVWRRRATPVPATLLMAACALALLPLGAVTIVASLSSFASLLAFAVVNAVLVILRFRQADSARPFRIPLALGRVPVLPVFGAACALFLISRLAPDVLVFGGVVLAVLITLLAIAERSRTWRL